MIKILRYGEDMGGIGDFIRMLIAYINYTDALSQKPYIHIDNENLKDLLLIKDEYKFNKDEFLDDKFEFIGVNHFVSKLRFPTGLHFMWNNCNVNLTNYIKFSDLVVKNYMSKMQEKKIISYECIHVRMGDEFGNASFPCKGQTCKGLENVELLIEKCINQCKTNCIIFLSDSQNLKQKVKEKYQLSKNEKEVPEVITFDTNILHLDSAYTKRVEHTKDDILNNFIEYFVMIHSDVNHILGDKRRISGFPLTASFFLNKPIYNHSISVKHGYNKEQIFYEVTEQIEKNVKPKLQNFLNESYK